ncbi:hypothetical protein SDJN02_15934, partial [Cucurbita argyrosperma subsp. argyrosperma]
MPGWKKDVYREEGSCKVDPVFLKMHFRIWLAQQQMINSSEFMFLLCIKRSAADDVDYALVKHVISLMYFDNSNKHDYCDSVWTTQLSISRLD